MACDSQPSGPRSHESSDRTPTSNSPPLQVQLVDAPRFITATRDSGYRSTAFAVAELIDNAIQANAQTVEIDVIETDHDTSPISIRVVDDGAGMDSASLSNVLAFGHSSRFDDRTSLGRYGMGLPNGPLSRARRVTIVSWRGPRAYATHLDIDEIVSEGRQSLDPPSIVERPEVMAHSDTGTAVILERCDRLEHKRAKTVAEHLAKEFARIYRNFLASGLQVRVDDEWLRPDDPMMLMSEAVLTGASSFGSPLSYQLAGPGGHGTVTVRFSELPIARWFDLPAKRKRELGVTNGATVTVLRAGREIDRGWFFMGSKRRENYDDWWRCEVAFEPTLDELFGLTHAKQTIVPSIPLVEVLAPDLEPIARSLNARARKRFKLAQTRAPLTIAERRAAQAADSLPVLRSRPTPPPPTIPPEALKDLEYLGKDPTPHRVIVCELRSTSPYELWVDGKRLVVAINSHHPLYRDLFERVVHEETSESQELAANLTLLVLAAARAEASLPRASERASVEIFRQSWGDMMATFMNSRL